MLTEYRTRRFNIVPPLAETCATVLRHGFVLSRLEELYPAGPAMRDQRDAANAIGPATGWWQFEKNGGVAAMEKVNRAKAKLIYDFLDQSKFFQSPVAVENRSLMNIPFTLKDAALDDEFIKGAKARGMVQIKGHRSVGGMRASIYNAMPVAGVQALVDWMKEFEKLHG